LKGGLRGKTKRSTEDGQWMVQLQSEWERPLVRKVGEERGTIDGACSKWEGKKKRKLLLKE